MAHPIAAPAITMKKHSSMRNLFAVKGHKCLQFYQRHLKYSQRVLTFIQISRDDYNIKDR